MTVARAAITSAQAAVLVGLRRLHDDLQHLFALQAGDVDLACDAVFQPAPTAAPETPAAQHPGWRLYDYMGQRLNCQQLADIAGCGYVTMHARLRKYDAEHSVGMGAANSLRRDLVPAPPREKREQKRHTFGNERLTVNELAERAGCTVEGMRQRLARGVSVADAVAAGKRMPRVAGKVRRVVLEPDELAGLTAALAPTSAPTQAPTAAPPASTHLPLSAWSKPIAVAEAPVKPRVPAGGFAAAPAAFKKDQVVVIPPGLVVQVVPTPPDRFAAAPGHIGPFSSRRPGEYEDSGSAIAKQYGGKP